VGSGAFGYAIAMNKPRLMIIFASTRRGRQGEPLALWVAQRAAQQGRLVVQYVDLADWMLPYYNHPLSPMEGEYPEEVLDWAEQVDRADAFLVVTPEYNHGYPAVLKSALDAVYAEWNDKPVAFVGYGEAAGGSRCVEQLREVVVELKLLPIRESMVVPYPWEKFDDLGQPYDIALEREAHLMLEQLAFWAETLMDVRDRSGMRAKARSVS